MKAKKKAKAKPKRRKAKPASTFSPEELAFAMRSLCYAIRHSDIGMAPEESAVILKVGNTAEMRALASLLLLMAAIDEKMEQEKA